MTRRFAQLYGRVIALDVSDEMLRLGRATSPVSATWSGYSAPVPTYSRPAGGRAVRAPSPTGGKIKPRDYADYDDSVFRQINGGSGLALS